jgi:hypothetical protein
MLLGTKPDSRGISNGMTTYRGAVGEQRGDRALVGQDARRSSASMRSASGSPAARRAAKSPSAIEIHWPSGPAWAWATVALAQRPVASPLSRVHNLYAAGSSPGAGSS